MVASRIRGGGRINARQVEAFRAVMLTGGMTSAAELAGVTQPAISRLVRDLEIRLGLVLFERRGNQILPTRDASTLLTEVERSFVGLSRIAETARAIRGLAAGSLRIVAMPAIASGVLPRFVGRFVRERPDLRVHLHGAPSHLVVEAVAAGQVDFGIADGPLERAGFLIERLPSPALVIMPPSHRLAARPRIRAEDLAGERIVTVASGTLSHARVETALAGIERIVRIETPLSAIACILVAEGAGISIVDPYSVSEYADALVARPFHPRIDIGMVLLRQPNRPSSPLAERFIEEFKAHLAVRVAALEPGPDEEPR